MTINKKLIFLSLWLLGLSHHAVAMEILSASVDPAAENLKIEIKVKPSYRELEEAFELDIADCLAQSAPVTACEVKLIDRDRGYRSGRPEILQLSFPLRNYALLATAYSAARLTISSPNAPSARTVQLPTASDPEVIPSNRLRYLSSHRPSTAYNGFSDLVTHNQFHNVVFGLSWSFVGGAHKYLLAYDFENSAILWRAQLESNNSISFISGSPLEDTMVIGGRFVRDGAAKSNLRLIQATTGETIRDFYGLEELDVTSAHWGQNQVLISHASVRDRQVSENSIIDFGIAKGVITWHDGATGRLIRTIDSPLREARVIEQSSDDQFVVFAGFEGAAIIDIHSGETVSFIHFSDIFGPAYTDCYNFGCGESHRGFSHYTVSADKRTIAISEQRGEIYLIDSQSNRINNTITPRTPDGHPLFIRTIKFDNLGENLYVYGAEHPTKPSNGHVLVYSLSDLQTRQWYQAGRVMGYSTGNVRGNIFSNDFKQLITADCNEGFADTTMLRKFYFRVYELEVFSE